MRSWFIFDTDALFRRSITFLEMMYACFQVRRRWFICWVSDKDEYEYPISVIIVVKGKKTSRRKFFVYEF